MTEFLPPCYSNQCPNFFIEQQTVQVNNKFCSSVFETIKNAGGVGFMEINPCPLAALADICESPSQEASELRTKLGVVGISLGGSV